MSEPDQASANPATYMHATLTAAATDMVMMADNGQNPGRRATGLFPMEKSRNPYRAPFSDDRKTECSSVAPDSTTLRIVARGFVHIFSQRFIAPLERCDS